MRHFSLLKLLTFSSFTTSPECLHPALVTHHHAETTTTVRKLSTALHSAATASCESTAADKASEASSSSISSRRHVLTSLFAGSASFALLSVQVAPAQALDMDAFINQQLESDTKNCDPKKDPKCKATLSADQALCTYGQSGEARGEACKRVKAAGGALPTPGSQGKSLGGAYAM